MEFTPEKTELGCTWHFAPQEGGREDGPNDAMMQNFRAKPYSALVREAVQNSLDAVLDISQPVRVEIAFSSLTARNFTNFFSLREHIIECRNYYDWDEKAVALYDSMAACFSKVSRGSNEIGYIHISDSNTKGMKYDPNSSQSPFYAFARAAGVSSKVDQQSGGSFGFGKSAYFQLSPIGTVFISSMTNNSQHAFEGVSWLCSHNYKGQKVCSVGYYDNNNGMPITDFEHIPKRFRRKEQGSSFYILGFKNELKQQAIEEMIDEALKSFWYAIYAHHLVIKIGDDEINAENLDTYILERFPDEIDDTAKSGYLKPRPYYLAVRDAGVSPKAKVFTEKLPILGECTLYLIKSDTPKDKIIYMRRPLMLVYGKRTSTSYGVFGTFICANIQGDKILQSLENPSHDEWKPANWRDRNNRIMDKGTDAMNEIQKFIMRCFASLSSNAEDTALEITDLDELLYIPEDLIDDDEDKDHEVGNPTSFVKDEGVSITTDINNMQGKQKDEPDTSNVGSVKIIKAGSSDDIDDEPSPDDPESIIAGVGGHSKKKSRIKGGQPTAGDAFKRMKIQNSNGTYKVHLPVRFRVVAQNEDGKNYHLLIIYCERDIINGELELITIGEQTDDVVNIEYTDKGIIHDNILKEVVLEEGRNILKILFKDNMRHAIKLKAYENQ